MSSIHELLKQVYPLKLRMELFNAIWINWRADIKEKDQQITDLQKQLAITEKALKLACEPRDDWGGEKYSGTKFNNYHDYFIAEAEQRLAEIGEKDE